MPHTIAIDARKLRDFGIGTYIRNILMELSRLDRATEYVVLCRPDDLDTIAALATSAGARWQPKMRQVDTYFGVSSGRLKLREIRIEDRSPVFELIGYQRPDETGARWSTYHRAQFDESTGQSVFSALSATLNLTMVVEKDRLVAILERTRIHLDTVAGLGAFVELETVTAGDDDPTAETELEQIVDLLGLGKFKVVAGSYSV